MKQAPRGFRYVTATREEVDAWRAKHGNRQPSSYRVVCVKCGKRMWGSGLGIGSHRRVCRPTVAELEKEESC